MRKLLALIAVLCCFNATSANAVTVFACEPEWAELAKEIGGNKVKTYSATKAMQDVHYIQAKPSLIANMRRADLVICSGADLEVGWLPVVLTKAGKSSLQEGGENMIYASRYIHTLEKPTRIDRADGDVHPDGNPHLHLNPNNMITIAKLITERLSALDADHQPFFEENLQKFSAKMKDKIKIWEQKAKPLKGANIIVNHKNMSYLFDWLNLKTAGTLEPKPGIPATSKHLAKMVQTVKRNNVKLIVLAPFEDKKPAEWLAQKTGVPYVVLPYTVGGNDEAKTLFDLYESNINILLGEIK